MSEKKTTKKTVAKPKAKKETVKKEVIKEITKEEIIEPVITESVKKTKERPEVITRGDEWYGVLIDCLEEISEKLDKIIERK